MRVSQSVVRLGRRDFFGAALLAKFLQKFFLVERLVAAQQFQKRIFQFFGKKQFGLIIVVGDSQSARRDQQRWVGSGTTGEKSDESRHLRPFVGSASRELYAHTKSRVHNANQAFRLYFHIFSFQTKHDY